MDLELYFSQLEELVNIESCSDDPALPGFRLACAGA